MARDAKGPEFVQFFGPVLKALKELGLDNGPTFGDNVGNPHKSGPASADNTDGAKEQVL